jgi:hypothetical protein
MAGQQRSSSRAPSVTNSQGDLSTCARYASTSTQTMPSIIYFTNSLPSVYINPLTSPAAFVPGTSTHTRTHSTLPSNSSLPSSLPYNSNLPDTLLNTSLDMGDRRPPPTDPRERATEDQTWEGSSLLPFLRHYYRMQNTADLERDIQRARRMLEAVVSARSVPFETSEPCV